MPDLREVELRIAVAEGVLSRSEADVLGEEARRAQQSPLALLVERGRISDESYQSFFAAALNDPAWRAAAHDASASTYTMQAMPQSTNEPPFPVAAWDRYTKVRFLGQGGMGMVFLAVDTGLRREVAIKFVRGDDAEHVRRLIAEARTQARVSHERVCRVYEVDEVEGKVYIAMQYIHGKPLGQLTGELTLEQKVMLVRGAADGIQEAHSKGIIHRDIKPSNVMVERTDDGDIRPYVMDFGLARSAQEAGTTMTGAVLGTPRYMAPEQAQGETAKLDRRADIYSLGATLYHVITGAPPIPGETAAEVIAHLISEEPIPPRRHDANIPADLEAIVLKCLEKDRTARYDSARALVEENLDRFLHGEPVHARPAGAWYRLTKLLAKHRRLVVAAAIALVALAVAIGWAIKTSGDAGERERLAREFTQGVERIESTARASALSPLHDVRSDRAAIRDQMAELAGKIQRAGAVAAGPGHYALGRGYLALGDEQQAWNELAAAWQGGFREPQVAYSLAVVMGHRYQQALLAAERSDNEDKSAKDARRQERREATKREITRSYRDPALGFLLQSDDAETPSPEYVPALVAFYEARLDDALKHVDAMTGVRPWFYEGRKLRGDILFARALGFRNDKQPERARSDFEAGRKAYAAAAEIGRSVPAVQTSLADLEYAAVAMEIYGNGEVTLPFARALAASDDALRTVPDDYGALVQRASIRRSLAEYRGRQGAAVEDVLAQALDDARRAIEISPLRPEARLAMARIYRQWGDYRKEREDDPIEQFRRAVAISQSILDRDRDAPYYMNLGLTYSLWADYQDDKGVESDANRGQSSASYHEALRYAEARHDKGQQRDIWINLGINLYKRASRPRGRDPDSDLQQALSALDKSKSIDPAGFVPDLYAGRVYARMAGRARARGADPGPDLERARLRLLAGLAINPNQPLLHNDIGAVFQDQAYAAWDRGEDPEPALVQEQAAFQRAIDVAPGQEYGYANVGLVFIQRAGFQRARDEDPAASVAAAVTWVNRAIERSPNSASIRADLGGAYAIQAGYDLEHGRDPLPSLDLASQAIGIALEKGSNEVLAQLYLGETLGLRARLRARQHQGSAADFEQAAAAFDKALALEPDTQDAPILAGQFYRAWAQFQRDAGGDPGDALSRGLALAKAVLDRRRSWPDALILRACLMLERAQSAHDAGARRSDAASAQQDFARALAINRSLEKTWAPQAANAARLAAP